MKHLKRSLAFFLLIVLAVSLVVPAYADDPTSGKCGPNATWDYNKKTETLTISGTGKTYYYSAWSDDYMQPWFYYTLSSISHIVVKEGITELGYGIFQCLHPLTVSLPSTLKKIGGEVFYRCGDFLNSQPLIIPDSVQELDPAAFKECNFKTIHLGKGVTAIPDECFFDAWAENINLENVKTIGKRAFYDASLKEADLRNVVTIKENAFERCVNLDSIVFGNKITSIGFEAFEDVDCYRNIEIIGNENDKARLISLQNNKYTYWPSDSIIIRYFPDVEARRWSFEAVDALREMGIVSGYPNGTFNPTGKVTRAEFAKMLCSMLPEGEAAENAGLTFNDVSEDKWFYPYVMKLAALGIVNGYADGGFHPGAAIARQDMATMINRMLNACGVELSAVNDPITFKDADNISAYAKDAVAAMQLAGVVNGFNDGTFGPTASATREQTAQMLYNLYKNMQSK